MVFHNIKVPAQQRPQCLRRRCCVRQHQRHWECKSPVEEHSRSLFHTRVYIWPCQDGPVALLLRVQVGSPTARERAGTARPRSSCLAHARRRLLCRDDPGPEQQHEPDLASPEPLLRERVRVAQGRGQKKKRDLLLFRDSVVIAKTK